MLLSIIIAQNVYGRMTVFSEAKGEVLHNPHTVACIILLCYCFLFESTMVHSCVLYRVMNHLIKQSFSHLNQLRIKYFLICFLSMGIASLSLSFLWGPLQPSRNEPLQEDANHTKQYGSDNGVNE